MIEHRHLPVFCLLGAWALIAIGLVIGLAGHEHMFARFGSLVVLVTMMSSVRERTDEIGIFRAIGYRKRHIMRIVFTEAAIVSGMAGIMGYLLGFAATKAGLTIFSENHSGMVPFSPELAGAVGLLIPVIRGIAGLGLAAFMIGAVATHVIHAEIGMIFVAGAILVGSAVVGWLRLPETLTFWRSFTSGQEAPALDRTA